MSHFSDSPERCGLCSTKDLPDSFITGDVDWMTVFQQRAAYCFIDMSRCFGAYSFVLVG